MYANTIGHQRNKSVSVMDQKANFHFINCQDQSSNQDFQVSGQKLDLKSFSVAIQENEIKPNARKEKGLFSQDSSMDKINDKASIDTDDNKGFMSYKFV